MNLLEQLFRKNANLIALVARVSFGSMIAYHGYLKLMDMNKFIGYISVLKLPFPPFFSVMAMGSELLGGALIVIGLKSRTAAFFLFITMIVAAFVAHGNDPFNKKEKALCYAVMCLFIMGFGPGRFSFDKN